MALRYDATQPPQLCGPWQGDTAPAFAHGYPQLRGLDGCGSASSASASARTASSSSSAPRRAGVGVGAALAAALAGRRQGERVRFPQPMEVGGRSITSAVVLREFRTATRAVLVELQPGGARFICKFEDLRMEHALMAALKQMNARWRSSGISLFGCPVQVVPYDILPLSVELGLVEAVPNSRTLCDLSRGLPHAERHLRVLQALASEPRRLDRLAATSVAYLTAGYALGIRDGHDDNLMLASDGSLFRIDLGFAFGRAPEIDAPATFVPNAVRVALGEYRWEEVVGTCGLALRALTGEGRGPPGWELLRSVPELRPVMHQAYIYAKTLSFEDFGRQVRRADEWTLARAAKNTLREAARYVMDEGPADAEPWLALDLFALISGAGSPAPAEPSPAPPAVARYRGWGRPTPKQRPLGAPHAQRHSGPRLSR
mmetsp:Transcript_66254/g.182975  ORF Transcript_66254/g.182975 Transcript_66254/m.182975 type:complete len:430 (-) Transcript_66254:68-1357(-)